LSLQRLARRRGAGAAAESVADALQALVVIGRRGAAGLQADLAAARLLGLGDLRQIDADVVVVRADEPRAILLVLRQQVGVPGQRRNARVLGGLERHGHRRRVRRRHGDAVDALADQVLDDLNLLRLRVLGRADIDALDVRQLSLRLLATVAR